MVQKSTKRGRPCAYDADDALARARDVFWQVGYAATSLDDISAATGMGRPSLYGAFGDKRALYLAALQHYQAMAGRDLRAALAPEQPVREGLRLVYDHSLALYFPAGQAARGCFLIGTAVTEAAADPHVRTALADGFRALDRAFEDRIRLAQRTGEVKKTDDPAALAKLASATLYFLAIRARTGETRETLEAVATSAIDLICGPADRGRPTTSTAR
ncbi:TetR/AcrR family transcriptional regulator [Shumkonia mesophila]|uniref:TetR/AcrR family transcriptional regulator n=1 Tax=Shumkonia mesophila TaxID=2838854 RepID=UPI00293495BF|nr:helix-turn-helix domain-containing protein [Shumkonia mesophila]